MKLITEYVENNLEVIAEQKKNGYKNEDNTKFFGYEEIN